MVRFSNLCKSPSKPAIFPNPIASVAFVTANNAPCQVQGDTAWGAVSRALFFSRNERSFRYSCPNIWFQCVGDVDESLYFETGLSA